MIQGEVKTLRNNPSLSGMANLIPDVVFSKVEGKELKMHLLVPWVSKDDDSARKKWPLIVFLQGSGYTFPDVNHQLAQLSAFARKGYVVASITHRNILVDHSPVAFLQDAKTAIRFLRKNADEYHIDPERVCFWGTSSGGHTALLVGMTGDDPRYKTDEYRDFSDSVSAVVDCYGPTNLREMLVRNSRTHDIIINFLGEDRHKYMGLLLKIIENKSLIRELSPLLIIEKNKPYPPVLLIHGDQDTIVPYSQSENMYKALIDNGYDAEMIRVENGTHDGSFWSVELFDEILNFIKRKL